jgi:hypothetical protein
MSVSGAAIIQLSGTFRFGADKRKNGAKFNQIFFGMPPQGIPASRIVSGNLATACGKNEVLYSLAKRIVSFRRYSNTWKSVPNRLR